MDCLDPLEKELLFEGVSYEIPVITDGLCLLFNENVPTAHLIQDFGTNYKILTLIESKKTGIYRLQESEIKEERNIQRYNY